MGSVKCDPKEAPVKSPESIDIGKTLDRIQYAGNPNVDAYEVLGLPHTSSADDVRSAYIKTCLNLVAFSNTLRSEDEYTKGVIQEAMDKVHESFMILRRPGSLNILHRFNADKFRSIEVDEIILEQLKGFKFSDQELDLIKGSKNDLYKLAVTDKIGQLTELLQKKIFDGEISPQEINANERLSHLILMSTLELVPREGENLNFLCLETFCNYLNDIGYDVTKIKDTPRLKDSLMLAIEEVRNEDRLKNNYQSREYLNKFLEDVINLGLYTPTELGIKTASY